MFNIESSSLHRYHPYRRPIALHLTFTPEVPITLKHTLHRRFSMHSDPRSSPPVIPLAFQKPTITAPSFFTSQTLQTESSTSHTIPKPPGEVGHPTRNGYSLQKALEWLVEVYKEVQVSHASTFFTSLFTFCVGLHP